MAGRNTTMARMTMKAKKTKGKMAKRHVVEQATHGGYTSTTQFHQPQYDPSQPSHSMEMIPDETAVHPTMEDAQSHMASMFGEGGDEGE
jgi:hypothetical protein